MDEAERLRALVQDERARRRWVEKELARETDRVLTWRRRAEDRTARIDLLEKRIEALTTRAPMSRVRGVLTAMRRAWWGAAPRPGTSSDEQFDASAKETVAPGPEPNREVRWSPRHRSYPVIRVANLGDPVLPFLHEFDAVDFAFNPEVLYEADFVFATVSDLIDGDGGTVAGLREWLQADARQPFAVWKDVLPTPEIASLVERADLTICRNPGGSVDVQVFAPGIDRAVMASFEVSAGGENVDDPAAARRLWHAQKRRSYRTNAPHVRAAELLKRLGFEAPERPQTVGVLLITNKPQLVMEAAQSALRQRNVATELVVGLHGVRDSFAGIDAELAEALGGSGRILYFDSRLTLGQCLNEAAATSNSPVLAKFDDDDWYGPHYLEDALAALDYSQADLVGKARYFVEIEHLGDTYLIDGPEERYSEHVIGSSIVFRRGLWEDVRFPHRPSRVDTVFLRGTRAVGGTIYSNSRFEFGVRRTRHGHTWQVDPAHFSARGERVAETLVDAEVDVADDLVQG